jgi:hypothetical protein
MPRISFAWAVITQSHQIKNVCGEFPKAVSSPCLVTSFSLNLDSNKRVHSRRWGNRAITLSMRTSMYFLSLESRKVPGINGLPKPCYQHCGTAGKASSPSVCTFHLWLLSCFLISILFNVQTCPILFICFSSSCRVLHVPPFP